MKTLLILFIAFWMGWTTIAIYNIYDTAEYVITDRHNKLNAWAKEK